MKPDANNEVLQIRIEGETEKALLPEVLRQLKALSALLRGLAASDDHTIEVLSLNMNSPLDAKVRVVKETKNKPATKGGAPRVKRQGVKTPLNRLQKAYDSLKGHGSKRAQDNRVEDMVALADFAASMQRTVTLTTSKSTMVVSPSLRKDLDDFLKNDVKSIGDFVGLLTMIEIHGQARFTIRPNAGPARISCHFDKNDTELVQQIKECWNHVVRVHGIKRTARNAYWPHLIQVQSLELLPKAKNGAWLQAIDEYSSDWDDATEELRNSIIAFAQG